MATMLNGTSKPLYWGFCWVIWPLRKGVDGSNPFQSVFYHTSLSTITEIVYQIGSTAVPQSPMLLYGVGYIIY